MKVFILDRLNVPVHLNRLHSGNPGFAVRWLRCFRLFFLFDKRHYARKGLLYESICVYLSSTPHEFDAFSCGAYAP